MLLYPGVCKKARACSTRDQVAAVARVLTCCAQQVMQLYGTRSLEGGAYLRADYAVRLPECCDAVQR